MTGLAWFEIPVAELKRAAHFYGAVLGTPLAVLDLGDLQMAPLPVGGALVQHPAYTPSHTGTLVYLTVGEDLAPALERVAAAGGKVLRGKTQVSPQFGFMAIFEDTEGNRVALHSVK